MGKTQKYNFPRWEAKNQKGSMDRIWWILPLIPVDRTLKMLSENAVDDDDDMRTKH